MNKKKDNIFANMLHNKKNDFGKNLLLIVHAFESVSTQIGFF